MSEKFWTEVIMATLAIVGILAVVKTKTTGWGPRSIQAMVIVLGVPAVVILAMEKILDSQAIAAILGGMVGFGAGKAGKD